MPLGFTPREAPQNRDTASLRDEDGQFLAALVFGFPKPFRENRLACIGEGLRYLKG